MNYTKISHSFDIIDYHDREIYLDKSELSNRYEISNIPIEILLFQTGYYTIRKKQITLQY